MNFSDFGRRGKEETWACGQAVGAGGWDKEDVCIGKFKLKSRFCKFWQTDQPTDGYHDSEGSYKTKYHLNNL